MPIDRYFIDAPLEGSVAIRDTEFHHMARVARLKVGERVELVNGKGALAVAELVEMEKREAWLSVVSVEQTPPPGRAHILAQAIPRLNRLDTIIEKATELGATEIWLFPGELSERKELTEHQLERLRAITVAALKQSGRLWLPKLEVKQTIQKWEKVACPCYFGDPEGKSFESVSGDALFLIGPESGLTDSEEKKLQQLLFQGVRLNPHILRTDTAAILAVGFLSKI